jgi:hypothetical protein
MEPSQRSAVGMLDRAERELHFSDSLKQVFPTTCRRDPVSVAASAELRTVTTANARDLGRCRAIARTHGCCQKE